MAEIKLN